MISTARLTLTFAMAAFSDPVDPNPKNKRKFSSWLSVRRVGIRRDARLAAARSKCALGLRRAQKYRLKRNKKVPKKSLELHFTTRLTAHTDPETILSLMKVFADTFIF